jgi:hypothetical protein
VGFGLRGRGPWSLATGTILIASLTVFLAASPAVQSKPRCKAGSEQAGCKLPLGASYRKNTKQGSATGFITATVTKNGFSLTFYRAYLKCTAGSPFISMVALATSLEGKTRPKVGKKYELKRIDNRNTETGPESTTTKATVKFSSARQAKLSLFYSSTAQGTLQCRGSLNATLKRQ